LLYISATCSGETIPAGKSKRERIFVVVSCCRSNCFFNSYDSVLDLFEDGSDDEVDDARDSFEELALDDDRPSKSGNALFGVEGRVEVGAEGKLEDEVGGSGAEVSTLKLPLGVYLHFLFRFEKGFTGF